MVKLDIWLDKLPEDKAKYYNRTRMSIELFAQKLGISPKVLLENFMCDGYIYDKNERVIRPLNTFNSFHRTVLKRKTVQHMLNMPNDSP